jgi:hypothetical protein
MRAAPFNPRYYYAFAAANVGPFQENGHFDKPTSTDFAASRLYVIRLLPRARLLRSTGRKDRKFWGRKIRGKKCQ